MVYKAIRSLTKVNTLLATGGGSSSDLWLALLGGALGVPLYRAVGEEGAARGAALLALVGAGVYPELKEALLATALPQVAAPPPLGKMGDLINDYELLVEGVLSYYQRQLL